MALLVTHLWSSAAVPSRNLEKDVWGMRQIIRTNSVRRSSPKFEYRILRNKITGQDTKTFGGQTNSIESSPPNIAAGRCLTSCPFDLLYGTSTTGYMYVCTSTCCTCLNVLNPSCYVCTTTKLLYYALSRYPSNKPPPPLPLSLSLF